MQNYLTRERLVPQGILFAVLLASAELGQYIYFGVDTSPALIWPATGIAVAALFLYGYRLWPAIALAALASALLAHLSFFVIVASVLSNTIQALAAAYILHKVGFDPEVRSVRSAIILIVTAFFATMIGPAISVAIQALSGSLVDPAGLTWSRAWGGRLLSVLIMTPLITTWFTGRRWILDRTQLRELGLMFLALISMGYFVFWTYIPALSGWSALIFLLPFLWIALRSTPRLMTLGLFLSTSIAVAGTIIAHPNATMSLWRSSPLFSWSSCAS